MTRSYKVPEVEKRMKENITQRDNGLKIPKLKKICIYFERENECTSGLGAERERESKRIPSRLCTVSMEPTVGA